MAGDTEHGYIKLKVSVFLYFSGFSSNMQPSVVFLTQSLLGLIGKIIYYWQVKRLSKLSHENLKLVCFLVTELIIHIPAMLACKLCFDSSIHNISAERQNCKTVTYFTYKINQTNSFIFILLYYGSDFQISFKIKQHECFASIQFN